jgi:hypothetical protein
MKHREIPNHPASLALKIVIAVCKEKLYSRYRP